MKFCKDCKHAEKGAMYWWCKRRSHKAVSPVDGSTVDVGTMDCGAERMGTYGACGPDGRFFEPKEKARE